MLSHPVENVATFEHLNLDFDSQSCVRIVNHRFPEETEIENYFMPGLYISMLGQCRCETFDDDGYKSCDYSYKYIVAAVEEAAISKLHFPSNSIWQTFSIMLPLNQFNEYILPKLKGITTATTIRKDRLAESGPVPRDILSCCEAVWQCTFQGVERELFIKAKALEVLSLFLHKRHEQDQNILTSRVMKLQNSLNYIQSHLSEEWTLASVSRMAGSNPTYVKQDIKELVGSSFRDWLKKARIESALEQLTGKDSISEIAHNIGFRSQAHFATLFKQEIGLSPSDFRRSLAI
ncbi:helix-turn-helix domain-containing protein [Marinomonas colpomeniae]|uniref:Helix-turn-helix transcriptional regulator n=1 Tax=Marinomonas colpomeniae TaxID=2774408 RepID=A0ABR8NXP7_9GAMM|nr:AraC family transcriptional regulator [Marinomonas colpomeniae]MBD5770798.1 helix-turn-helix transcriptional regulator [Marinomonas colpomeniae]